MAILGDTTVELRPAHLEDWIDALPYVDFLRTAQILAAALAATNATSLKPGLRFELLCRYWRPYHYLVNTVVSPGATPALRSVESLRQRVDALQRIAAELAAGVQQTLTEPPQRKSLFGHVRSPNEARVALARVQSHALVLNYHSYAPAPVEVWRDLNAVYLECERSGQLSEPCIVFDDDRSAPATVHEIYVETALTTLADPYHLPAGAVWEIYAQLHEWARLVKISAFAPVRNPAGYFVADLRAALAPVPYVKFDASHAGPAHRLLDCSVVQQHVHAHLQQLSAGGGIDPGLKFGRAHARTVLELLQRAWGLPPKRYFPRREKSGQALVACGYKAAYWTYHTAHAEPAAGGDADVIEIGGEPAANTPGGRYGLERWNYLNEGSSGFAIYSAEKPQHPLRVGELLSVQDLGRNPAQWVIGVVRWMMVQRDGAHHIGIQTLTRDAEAVNVRVLGATSNEVTVQPAFLISDPSATNGFTLIGPHGLHGPERTIEIEVGQTRLQFKMGSLRESTVAYDFFSCRT